MRFYDAEDVHRICRWRDLVDSLAQAHLGPKPYVDRSEIHHQTQTERQTYFNLPAFQPGEAFATKICTVMPGNTADPDGPPAVQAIVVLFDGKDGRPLAVIDGTALTYRKTAADSALGCDLLARRDVSKLAMIGAGGLSRYLIDAHLAMRPSLSEIAIWNRSAAKAAKLAEDLCAGELNARVVETPRQAVEDADIVSCATASTEPVVNGDWLKPGCHLDLVGSFTPDMREADDTCILRARLFVDSNWFAIDQPGDLADPIARSIISRKDIEADLFDLCAPGYAVKRQKDDVTLYKNGGGAHLDLFTARFIHAAASV